MRPPELTTSAMNPTASVTRRGSLPGPSFSGMRDASTSSLASSRTALLQAQDGVYLRRQRHGVEEVANRNLVGHPVHVDGRSVWVQRAYLKNLCGSRVEDSSGLPRAPASTASATQLALPPSGPAATTRESRSPPAGNGTRNWTTEGPATRRVNTVPRPSVPAAFGP